MLEIWKDIKGYEGLYQVSNKARVKGLRRVRVNNYGSYSVVDETILKLRISNGYYSVGLCKDGIQVQFYVHRLVADAFIPNPDNLPVVNHKDENKLNNLIWVDDDGTVDYEKSNLEWCTQEYNINYGTRNKRVGNRNINGKKSIKVLQYDLNGNFIKEWPSAMEIQRQLGYNNVTIRRCCNGLTKSAYNQIWH